MRAGILGLIVSVLAVGGAQAQPARQPTPARSAAEPLANTAAKPDYERARRESDDRQKRWDERMRRATKSMCVGC